MELVNDVKIYSPGDPEFDVIASSITPLHRIRNRCLSDNSDKEEAEIVINYRRKEEVMNV